ncbi:preprotein translocase subunit SecG [Paracoccus contaminans]|uniref:Protein-export membrane protein SecG n=1 Tax=Paracoccus contaminans TaxID=1945662 RepID=A0A1W6D0B2_9RHOB|nr:preprotein translocase subunit SecG [Paracoccus contaminans]ARJ70536.1 preprotein translocase subunit SecG [Paracoccus contaminans]
MENVVLTVHLILALLLIGVVLLQRSEGGGLGMGGGSGVMTGRQAANALTRATWTLAIGFILTSITLTVIAAGAGGGSVVDRLGGGAAPAPTAPASRLPTLPAYAPPPGSGQPVLPPGAAGSTPPAQPAAGAAAPVPATPAVADPAPAGGVPAAQAPAAPVPAGTAAEPAVKRTTVPITAPGTN